MKYQVGDLTAFMDNDPEFDTREAAFDYAATYSDDHYEDVLGIWTSQDDGSELIAIAHNGELFRRDLRDFGVEFSLPFISKGNTN